MARKKPTSFVIVRDAILLGVGILGIMYQQLTGEVNPLLLAVYTSMTGMPAAAHVLEILRPQNTVTQPTSSSRRGSASARGSEQ